MVESYEVEHHMSQSTTLFQRLRTRSLAITFAILTTLSIGILAGSVLTRNVHGKEAQVNSSDAAALTIPSPTNLSNGFSAIVKQVGPAVVNINTESLPKQQSRSRRFHGRTNQTPDNGDGDGGGGSANNSGPQSGGQGQGGGQGNNSQDFQDFFNRFFGGQMGPGQGAPGQGDDGEGPDGGIRQALGSGFIVDPRGYIVTNNHVVDKADHIWVKLSTDPDGGPGDLGRPAKVIGVDKDTDLAVIKIETTQPLPIMKLGNSDGAQVGDWVLAIGSPFGLSQTVSAGIVSAKNRTIEGGAQGQFQRFIQTDAAINPGNSGGPLVDMAGNAIGVNTAIYTQSAGYEGVGFAMPSNTVINVYNQLIGPDHKVTRGSIGVTFQGALSTAVSRVYGIKNGVLVNSVEPNGPAAAAGIKAGDVITSVDGASIKDGDGLVANISPRKPGSTVTLGYVRDGKPATATVKIADRAKLFSDLLGQNDGSDSSGQPDPAQGKIGIAIRAVSPELASKLGIHGGVQVVSVRPGSLADEIGLSQGDVILEVNRKPISDEKSFSDTIAELKSGQDVAFLIRDPRVRGGGNTYVGGTIP